MAIVEDIVRLGSELPPELGISDLQARAGIHTGEVLVAAVTAGGQERLPDVWGQVPNMAARLQAAGEPGQIVVSGDTADLVAGFFELESLGSLDAEGHRASRCPPSVWCSGAQRGTGWKPGR